MFLPVNERCKQVTVYFSSMKENYVCEEKDDLTKNMMLKKSKYCLMKMNKIVGISKYDILLENIISYNYWVKM